MTTIQDQISSFDSYFSDNTKTLIDLYVGAIKNNSDKQAYMKAFRMLAEATRKDFFECDEKDFSKYKDMQTERYQSGEISYSTYAKYYKIIAAFSRYCYKLSIAVPPSPLVPEDYEDRVVSIRINAPSDVFRQDKIPSLTTIDKVIGYTREHDKLTFFAVVLSVGTFLRTGELLDITVSDLFKDSANNWHIHLKKDNANIPIPEVLGIELSDFCKYGLEPTDSVFSVTYGGKRKTMTKAALVKRVAKACEAVGEPKFTIDELRNASAVYSASAGATGAQIAEAMRYKTNFHIGKLTSLKVAPRDTALKYIHFSFPEEGT